MIPTWRIPLQAVCSGTMTRRCPDQARPDVIVVIEEKGTGGTPVVVWQACHQCARDVTANYQHRRT